jgi:hypothetical protein
VWTNFISQKDNQVSHQCYKKKCIWKLLNALILLDQFFFSFYLFMTVGVFFLSVLFVCFVCLFSFLFCFFLLGCLFVCCFLWAYHNIVHLFIFPDTMNDERFEFFLVFHNWNISYKSSILKMHPFLILYITCGRIYKLDLSIVKYFK